MIRAEIRFKNSAFWTALEKNGYKSMAEFSRQAKIRYDRLLSYANLRYAFEDDFDSRQVMMALLQSDEWTLFDQYKKVVEKKVGIKKITTEIPIDKVISLESREVLMLESPDGIDESMIKESLEIDVSSALNTLKIRERQVLELFYGINRPYPLDLDEIAEEFGLSRERTRQIKEKAIRRLRHRSRSENLAGYIGWNLEEIRTENQRKLEEENEKCLEVFNNSAMHISETYNKTKKGKING